MRRSRPLGLALSFGVASLAVVVLALGGCGRSTAEAPRGTPLATPVPYKVIAQGSQLYATNCQVCHGDKDGVGGLPPAPSHGNDGHTWMHSDRNLTDIILNGPGEMGEMMRQGVPEDAPRMPAWKGKLSEEEIRAILAYIKTFWSPERRRMQEQSPMMP